MITQTIAPHKEKWDTPQYYKRPPYIEINGAGSLAGKRWDTFTRMWVPINSPLSLAHNVVATPTPTSTKGYYTEWLKTVPFKRGDYVVYKHKVWPYKEGDLLRVIQLQEVHHFVKYDDEGKPIVMELINSLGTRFWTNVAVWRKEIEPHPSEQINLPEA